MYVKELWSERLLCIKAEYAEMYRTHRSAGLLKDCIPERQEEAVTLHHCLVCKCVPGCDITTMIHSKWTVFAPKHIHTGIVHTEYLELVSEKRGKVDFP